MGTKIVLDTNVLISAFGWKGASREIFHKCIEGKLDVKEFEGTKIVSPEVFKHL